MYLCKREKLQNVTRFFVYYEQFFNTVLHFENMHLENAIENSTKNSNLYIALTYLTVLFVVPIN